MLHPGLRTLALSVLGVSPLALLLVGCGLVLDEPTAFTVEGAVSDSAVSPDAGDPADVAVLLDGPLAVDAAQPMDGPTPDVSLDGPIPDAEVILVPQDVGPDAAEPDAQPDVARPDTGPPCVPVDENCNGEDDDCDGVTDESYAEACAVCGPDEGNGVCGTGVVLCVDGALICAGWLPDPDTVQACDLIDNDCDGRTDEGGEVLRARSPVEDRAIAECGVPLLKIAAPSVDDCVGQPGRVGCAAPHACLAPDCVQNCEDSRDAALAACALACPEEQDDLLRAGCWGRCRDTVAASHRGCLTTCGERVTSATRWMCDEEVGGPVCTAVDCPPDFRVAGRACVPNVEICNNGLDDDNDGLIDGTLDGPDPCAVSFDQRGTPMELGVCRDLDAPGCEDNRRVVSGSGYGRAESCGVDGCGPTLVDLSYVFAVDKEEVSVRGYAECVLSGCCLPPEGPVYARVAAGLEAGTVEPRPENPNRCAGPVDALNEEDVTKLADLPVTGLSWCQARDYCNWVGKRLPTEYEWERAAMGLGERRTYPWGDTAPAVCIEDQCCRNEAFLGEAPGLCDGDLLICPADPPVQTRLACQGVYNFDDPNCAPNGGPAPVYGNQDGQTPEGLLNMAGNVGEWVYDWSSESYRGTPALDPVGPACDSERIPFKRMTRGSAFVSRAEKSQIIDRIPLFDTVRAPILGFRCGRSVTDDGSLCDPGTDEIPGACRPGADARTGAEGQMNPQCSAPDLTLAAEEQTCDGVRNIQGSGECSRGLEDFCAAEPVPGGCGTFLFNRLRLPAPLVGEQEASSFINILFDASLGPKGGSTLFAISLPENFDIISREWNASLGSAQINADGGLSWLGLLDGGLCGQTDVLPFRVRTVQGQRSIRPVCRATDGQGQLWFRSAPLSLAFTGMGLTANYEPQAGLLEGTLVLVLTPPDLRRSTFGAPDQAAGEQGVEAVFNDLGLQAQNLCNQPLLPLGSDCLAEPLILPGCDADNNCTDPDACMGFTLPFEFSAIRAPQAGILGLDACPAP